MSQSAKNDDEGKKQLDRPDGILRGDPDFSDDDFQRIWNQIISDVDVPDISIEEVKIIYNEILHLRFNANNFCLSIPDEHE